VVGAGVAVAIMAGGKEPAPKPAPKPLAPVVEPEPVEAPKPAAKAPPPPLTEKEKAYVQGLFDQAEPHMKKFYEYADKGWALDDEAERNAAWKVAKEEAHKAIQIVVEAMEDFDRFPMERQTAHMRRWNDRLTGWQKDLQGKIGKVH